MKVSYECMYCGHKWVAEVYNKYQTESATCLKCNDSSLIVRNAEDKIDYYQGCPPFPEKKRKDDKDYVPEMDDYFRYLTNVD